MKRLSFVILSLCLSFVSFSQTEKDLIHIVFAGDVMGHGPQIKGAYYDTLKAYNYDSCFLYVRPIIKKADLAIANLEVTLAGPEYKGYPQFSSPDELADGLKNNGFDFIVTANNHSVDRGDEGIKRTIEVLDKKGIKHTGTFTDTSQRAKDYPFIFEIDSLKLAFLNVTYGTNGLKAKKHIVNYIDTLEIKKDINSAKAKKADMIFLIVHWGAEYQRNANKEQRNLATYLFNNGIDVIIGSHPHVVQEIEADTVIKNADTTFKNLIFYSHGNFVSNQRDRYKDGGILGHIFLEKRDSTVVLKDFGYTPVWVRKKPEGSVSRYYCIPSPASGQPKLEKAEQEQYDQFLDDTRKHLKGLREIR